MFTTQWDLYTSEEILLTSIGPITKDIGARFIADDPFKPTCPHYANNKHNTAKCKLCSNVNEEYEFSHESEGTLCDRRMGPRHKNELCATCKQSHDECRGHFMHLTLAEPIITDEMFPYVYKLLLKENKKINADRTLNQFITIVVDKNGKNVEKIIKASDLLNQNFKKWDRYILQHLIIIPNNARPYEPFKKNEWRANDLTSLYAKIIECNFELQQHLTTPIVYNNKYLALLNAIRVFYNSSKKYNSYSSVKQICSGIKQRIDGNDGRIKGDIIGKRVNFIARTVISPDITLQVDEIGLPSRYCDLLTTPEYVTPYNIDQIQMEITKMQSDLANEDHYIRTLIHEKLNRINGLGLKSFENDSRYKWLLGMKGFGVPMPLRDRYKIHETKDGECFDLRYVKNHKINVGDIIHRTLENGDLVVYNRQPSLHKGSMMAGKVKRIWGDTIRLPLSVCPPLNADFDGDEINIHVPQTLEARVDAQELIQVKHNILSCQSNKTIIRLIYDAVLGIREITKPNVILSKQTIGDVCCWLNRWDIPTTDEWLIFGLDFIHFLLPNAGYGFEDLLKEGPINNSIINKIIKRLFYEYNGDVVIRFLSDVQFLTNYWMSFQGYSTHILDSTPQLDMPKLPKEPDLSLQTTEIQKIARLNELRDSYRMNVNLQETNGLIRMITSGSKGHEVNYLQASFVLGLQALNGNRLKSYDGTRLTAHFPHRDKNTPPGAIEGGYVNGNFFFGLNPLENYTHSIVGRSGVADTAVLVPDSGYLNKQLCDKLKNVKVHYDGTVRLDNTKIIQRKYGGDGYLSEYLEMDTNKVYYLNSDFLKRQLKQPREFETYYNDINDQIKDVYSRFGMLEPFNCVISSVTPREFYDEIEEFLNRATACAGTFVGTLAAHSISEPATQLSLNTIHSTGISSKAITGFPRMKQLTQCSERTVFLFMDDNAPLLECEETVNSCFSAFVFSTEYKKPLNETWELRYMASFFPYDSIDLKSTGEYVIEFVQKKHIPIENIKTFLKSLTDVYEKRIRYSNYKYEDLIIRIYFDDLKKAENELKKIRKTNLYGISGLLECFNGNEYNIGEYKEFVTASIYKQILNTHPTCKTNSVRLVNEVFGIEACSNYLCKELDKVISQNGRINSRHYELLVDVMCYSGTPQSILRIDMTDTSSLSRASFQKSTEMLLYGAVNKQIDLQTSVVSKMAFGKRLDEDMIGIEFNVIERKIL